MNSPLIKPLLLALALAPQAFADYCNGGSFIEATGTGKTPGEARSKAKAEIASNIISHIKSKTKTTSYSEESDGILREGGRFESASTIESDLTLQGFQDMEPPRRLPGGEYELRAYVCVKDAAKPYLEKQRVLQESMEVSKDWHKIQSNWNELMGIQIILESLGAESKYAASAKKLYEKAKKDYKDNCSAKLHWNPEKKTEYSEIAFSKLSAVVKMENTPCAGKGISIAYKGEPACKSSGGPYGCSCQPSLRIAYCSGAELRLLESPSPIKSFDQKEDLALKKLQDKLKAENFWNEWEQEIKQWRPQCEQ